MMDEVSCFGIHITKAKLYQTQFFLTYWGLIHSAYSSDTWPGTAIAYERSLSRLTREIPSFLLTKLTFRKTDTEDPLERL